MVTFGSTTTFGAPTPAPAPSAGGFSFGSPTSAPATTGAASGGGLFGSTPAAAPAAATGFSFGSTPASAPAPSTGLFGSSAPAAPTPSTGLFGSSAAPAPSTGLFGSNPAPAPVSGTGLFGSSTPAAAPTTSLFGSPAPAPMTSLFGSTAATPGSTMPPFGSPNPQVTATNNQQTAAIFAQQQEARQLAEAQRLEIALTKLHAAYNTTNPTTECRFQHIFYDPADANTIYQYTMMGKRSHQPHVDPKVWAEAEAYNPDHNSYIPVSVVGAEQLQSRVSSQQAKAIKLKETLQKLRTSIDGVNKGIVKSNAIAQTYKRDQECLMQQLLRTLRKVETLRCMNVPTQSGEREFREKLNQISREISTVNIALKEVVKNAERCKSERFLQESVADLSQDDQARIARALRDQKQALETLKKVSRTDVRDLEIMKSDLARRLSPYT